MGCSFSDTGPVLYLILRYWTFAFTFRNTEDTLEAKFGGDTRKIRRQSGSQRSQHGLVPSRRLRGINTLLVRGKNHMACIRRSKERVREALHRLHKKHFSAFVPVRNTVWIPDLLTAEQSRSSAMKDLRADVLHNNDDTERVPNTKESMHTHKKTRSPRASFIDGSRFPSDLNTKVATVHAALEDSKILLFHGRQTGCCGNGRSVLSLNKNKT